MTKAKRNFQKHDIIRTVPVHDLTDEEMDRIRAAQVETTKPYRLDDLDDDGNLRDISER